jgi:hypothetical protein
MSDRDQSNTYASEEKRPAMCGVRRFRAEFREKDHSSGKSLPLRHAPSGSGSPLTRDGLPRVFEIAAFA